MGEPHARRQIRTPTDIIDEDHPFGRFISAGGFHNPHAVLAMDALTAACANLCVLAERQGAKLLDGDVLSFA